MAVNKVASPKKEPAKKAAPVKPAKAWEPRTGPAPTKRSPAKAAAIAKDHKEPPKPIPGAKDKPPPGVKRPKGAAPEIVLKHEKPKKRPPRVPIPPIKTDAEIPVTRPPGYGDAPGAPVDAPPASAPARAPLLDGQGRPLPSFLIAPQEAFAAIMPAQEPYGIKINEGLKNKRETKFTLEVFLDICDYIAEGATLRDVCELFKDDPRYPSPSGFNYWLYEASKPENRDDPEKKGLCGIADAYARAIETRRDAWETRMLHAASVPNERLKVTVTESEKDGRSTKTESYDNVERSRLLVGALQWIMSKSGQRATESNDIRVHGGLPPEPQYDDPEEDMPDDTDEEVNDA